MARRSAFLDAVWNGVAAYEDHCLFAKWGWHVRAGRTRQALATRPAEEVLARWITRRKRAEVLRTLADAGLLQHSFEQVIIDHPRRFDKATVAQARLNLSRYLPPGLQNQRDTTQ